MAERPDAPEPEHTQEEVLFDHGYPVPVRRGRPGYLAAVSGIYEGMEFWALAPIDRPTIDHHGAPPDTSEFVWLVDATGTLSYALVDVETHTVIDLEPTVRDLRVRAALAYRRTTTSSPPEGAS